MQPADDGNAADLPTGSDVPDCNPFPLSSMIRVDVKKKHECFRFVQYHFSLWGQLFPFIPH